MKTILITGGAGFVGQNLVPILKKEFRIIVIDKHKENLQLLKKINPEIEIIYTNLSKKTKWINKFKQIDNVIQLNGQIKNNSKNDYIKNNIIATKNILYAMNKFKIKNIIHISSASVNSRIITNYGNTKKIGEEIIISNKKINYIILRPSLMYGPLDNKNISFIINFLKNSPVYPIPGLGKYPRQPLFVEDFVKIIKYLIRTKPKNKIYNINGDKINYISLIKTIKKIMKIKSINVYLPKSVFIFLVKINNIIFNQNDFTKDEINSLTSKDVFKGISWESEFNIKKTSLAKGLNIMLKSKYKYITLKK